MATDAEMLELDPSLNKIYPLTVIFPMMSFLSAFLCVPPFAWHLRKRNTGASALTFWLIMLNFFSFVNGMIWPTDNIFEWWSGTVFCDIEIRLFLGGTVGVQAGVLCIMRDLARALDTNRPRGSSDAQKRNRLIVDLLLCFGLPTYFMAIYYIVQPGRYYVFAIQGCWPPIDDSWLSIVLLFMWPLLLLVVAGYYACLILVRIYRHRRDFSRLLSSASTTRSRFVRLFIVALMALFCFLPLQIYYVVKIIPNLHPFHWSWTHSNWNAVVNYPTQGHILLWDHWVWITCGYIVFAFFGLAADAREMYMAWMKKSGIGKIFPSLSETGSRNGTTISTASSWSIKAKMVFKKVGLGSSNWSSISAKLSGKDSMFSSSTMSGRDSVDPALRMSRQECGRFTEETHPKRSFLRTAVCSWSSRLTSNHKNEEDIDIEAGLSGRDMIEKMGC